MRRYHTDDAGQYWCPFARVQFIGTPGVNRIDPVYMSYQQGPDREHFERQAAQCQCIGEKCAAWEPGHMEPGVGRCGLVPAPPLR